MLQLDLKNILPLSPEYVNDNVFIYPFTRQYQRYLGWGDVCLTKKDIEKVIENGYVSDLNQIMPYVSTSIDNHNLLPSLCDSIQDNTPALIDCHHEFSLLLIIIFIRIIWKKS